MEPNLVLSLGSILSVFGLFYTWHKDSKKNAEEMAELKIRVNNLETRALKTDSTLAELLIAVNEIKVALGKIDTKISNLEKDK
tara:strand:- start:259 stop:507 length:249 start_codon:yes stop_codon:yes gene_type:complete